MTRLERIRKVAIEHPDMPLELLAERFGETKKVISHILLAVGIRRERDLFSEYINGRRSA